jgi:hypothetical protein
MRIFVHPAAKRPGSSNCRSAVALASAFALLGCAGLLGDDPNAPSPGLIRRPDGGSVTQMELQQDIERFASQFMDRIAQATEPLTASQKFAERDAALKLAVRYESAALDIASGPFPQINVVDMIVFVRLSGDALERHWMPSVLGPDAREMIDVFRTSERDLWSLSNKILTSAQQGEVDALIAHWQAEHPNQYRVEGVRFSAFAEHAGEISEERQRSARGLMGQVRAATQTADQALLLSERAMFLATRLPFLIRLHVRVGMQETLSDTLARLDNVQALMDEVPELRPLITESSSLLAEATQAARETQGLANSFLPYLDWLGERTADGKPRVSLNQTLASANQLTGTSLEIVRELRAAAPKDSGAMLQKLEQRTDRLARKLMLYLLLLGLGWSVLFWGGYYVVKRLVDARATAVAAPPPGE